jgi:hypothetical protein
MPSLCVSATEARAIQALNPGETIEIRRSCRQGTDHGDIAHAIAPAARSGFIAWFGTPFKDLDHAEAFTQLVYETGFESPFGPAGTRLAVREKWGVYRFEAPGGGLEYPNIIYWADNSTRLVIRDEVWKYTKDPTSRSGATMPLWASRAVLETLSVRVEPAGDAWQWVGTLARVSA